MIGLMLRSFDISPVNHVPGFAVWALAGIFSSLLISTPMIPAESGRDQFESSIICESCHSDIYEEWKESSHAVSWEDSLYQDSYASVQSGPSKEACLACHAPVALSTGDRLAMRGISREGVTCDYCHTLQSGGSPGSQGTFHSKVGREKVGRISDGRSIYHGIKVEEDFGGARFCAACHNYVNAYGVLIYSDYESWKSSYYNQRGVDCRSCHMPETPGRASNFGNGRDTVPSHRFSGGGSVEMLRKACSFNASLSAGGDSVRIRTSLSNRGAGHKFPGGSPLREVVVKFTGLDPSGRELFEYDSLRYGVEFEAPEGDSLDIWAARSIISDTRIDPGEKRIDTTILPIVGSLDRIEVSLLLYPIPLKVVKRRGLEMKPPEIYRHVLKVR